MAATDVVRHQGLVDPAERERRNGHRGAAVWLTGRPGAGKSTVAAEAEHILFRRGVQVLVLDGDNLRLGLNRDLGFSPEERAENVRRTGEVARLLAGNGVLVLAALVSPFRKDRDTVRGLLPAGAFLEVFIRADLETCAARDPKGHYRKAREGGIAGFTGLSAPYEEPAAPELVIDTAGRGPRACAESLVACLEERGILPRRPA